MRVNKQIFCSFAALLFLPVLTQAMHIIGGEMTYQYLLQTANGSLRYRFTLKIYRDCNGGGAPFDDPAQIAIYRGTNTANTLFANFSVSGPDITKIQPVPPPCVTDLPNECVEQGVYVFERDLPVLSQINESYFIVYQRCCRNVTIRNLINPGDQGATYMVELTKRAMDVQNDSPVFTNFPPIIICNGIPLVFDHSATDADGDFLSYSFCSPLNGGGPILSAPALFSCEGAQPTPPCAPPFSNVPFVAPNYTPGNPMGGSPQITINPSTGQISGQPNVLGQFVVGVCVQEFRNGVLLSTVQRDFQFNVADCKPDVFADIQEDSIAGLKKYVLISCGENTVTFKNQSVQRSNVEVFRWVFDLKNGNIFEDSQNWDPTVTFPDTGVYNGKLYLNPGLDCADSALITIGIYPEINAGFSYDYDTCVAGPVVFTDHSSGEGGINRWYWDFGVPNGKSREINPEYLYPIPGTHPVRLIVYDKNNCRDDSTAIIAWYPAPPLIIVEPSTFRGCAPADIFFNNLSAPIDSTYKIEWDFGDGSTMTNVISPTHLYEQPGTYDIKVAITSPLGCFIADSFQNWIQVFPSPLADFTCDPDSGLSNFNKTVQFIDKSTNAWRWNWQFDKYRTSNVQNPVFTFPDTGRVTVRLIVTHQSGCQDSLSKTLDIKPEIRWFMPNAFTPNGDGSNEGFLGKGYIEGSTDFNMSIWNRWGEKVFESSDPNEAWNGRVMNTGGMSPMGVYVYLVTFIGPRKERLEFRGFATLVK